MGICEILTVIFVVLKVLGVGTVAAWAWWQVLLPEIIAVGIYAAVFLVWLIAVKIIGRMS